jgi:LPXTG-motif cell wall-anchored protein
LARLATIAATAAAGGAVALVVGGPASAQEDADYNRDLHGPHNDRMAVAERWPACGTVRADLGDEADRLIKDGQDVWVFYIPEGWFDTTGSVAKIYFTGSGIDPPPVTVPEDPEDTAYQHWVGPETMPNMLAVSVPAGWTLSHARFNVVNSEDLVEVKRTCPDGADETPTPEPSGEGGALDLPVTGAQVGGMVILGGGLLAAGIAMTAVKRRRDLSDLLGD